MDHPQDIRGRLQDTFATYEAEPSRDLWPGVAAGLRPAPVRRARWPYLAIAASVAILIGCWVLLRPDTPPPTGPQPLSHQLLPLPPVQHMPAPAEAPAQPPQAALATAVPPLPTDVTPAAPRPQLAVVQHPVIPAQPEPRPVVAATPLTPPAPSLAPAALEPVPVLPTTQLAQVAPPSYSESFGSRNSLNLNELKPEDLVTFASRELSKWARSPIDVTHEERPNQEIRTYQLDILNLTITRKTHRTTNH